MEPDKMKELTQCMKDNGKTTFLEVVSYTEAECMRRALVRRGVDESRLYPEERSTSTQENLRYSRAILEELGVDPAQRVAIVTSDFHLCRARLMWGGDTAAVPAHLPSALYFQCLTVNYFIREAFGLAAYFVYGG